MPHYVRGAWNSKRRREKCAGRSARSEGALALSSLAVGLDSNYPENPQVSISQAIPRRSPRHDWARARRLDAMDGLARLGVANLDPSACGVLEGSCQQADSAVVWYSLPSSLPPTTKLPSNVKPKAGKYIKKNLASCGVHPTYTPHRPDHRGQGSPAYPIGGVPE
jgi:hypothetical protein